MFSAAKKRPVAIILAISLMHGCAQTPQGAQMQAVSTGRSALTTSEEQVVSNITQLVLGAGTLPAILESITPEMINRAQSESLRSQVVELAGATDDELPDLCAEIVGEANAAACTTEEMLTLLKRVGEQVFTAPPSAHQYALAGSLGNTSGGAAQTGTDQQPDGSIDNLPRISDGLLDGVSDPGAIAGGPVILVVWGVGLVVLSFMAWKGNRMISLAKDKKTAQRQCSAALQTVVSMAQNQKIDAQRLPMCAPFEEKNRCAAFLRNISSILSELEGNLGKPQAQADFAAACGFLSKHQKVSSTASVLNDGAALVRDTSFYTDAKLYRDF